MDIHGLINDLIALGAKVSLVVELPDDKPAPQPEPTPAPQPKLATFRVAQRAVARFASSQNKAGRPIMEIYPSDNSSPSVRVIYNSGEKLSVYADATTADGGGRYYQVNQTQVHTTLFVRAEDGVIEV